ncbi:MAG: Hsp20/alpha crystallin family protein [Marinicaulis sp.]|nr:Hsp20/alpha crystallin family protein [Marinicaulis sp.]
MELNALVPFRNRRRQATRDGALSPFERMHEEMDRLFDDFLPQLSDCRDGGVRFGALASVDLSETEDALELSVDLPGMAEDKIDITLRDGALTIVGERKDESEEKRKNYYRSERAYGAFSRTISLPCEVDEDAVDAKFTKGVLTIHMPKSQKAKEHERKIAIKVA